MDTEDHGNVFPQLFLVGAPKCGTTTIYQWLKQHPDTYLPIKEPNFFSSDLLDVSDQYGASTTIEEYLSRLCPPDATGKLTGDCTPKYLYSEMALSMLKTQLGSIKILITLRNPVDLAAAMHAQNVRQGRDPQPDFAKAWHRGPQSPGDKMTDYAFWGRPGVWLQRYLDTFPPEDCMVLMLEDDLRTNAQATHAKVLDFLGLAPQALENYGATNARKTYRSARLQGLSRRARRSLYGTLGRLGFQPRGTGLLAILDKMNGNRVGREKISPAFRAEIASTLADDVQLIRDSLDRKRLPWADFDPHFQETD